MFFVQYLLAAILFLDLGLGTWELCQTYLKYDKSLAPMQLSPLFLRLNSETTSGGDYHISQGSERRQKREADGLQKCSEYEPATKFEIYKVGSADAHLTMVISAIVEPETKLQTD